MNHSIFLVLACAAFLNMRADDCVLRIGIGDRVTGSFDPGHALGAGLDGHAQGETARMLSPQSVRGMLGAGLGPVSVRLRTELAVEAWHWNPSGSWSDPSHSRGYWTSDAKPDPAHPIDLSYGYKLPRRGNTLDEANDDGYSRLDDGNPETFWKSNPYLTQSYTGEPDNHHPQWVVLDLGKPVPVNAVNIQWGEPYGKKFRVEYAAKGRVYFGGHPWNVWHAFPRGVVSNGSGGVQFLRLCGKPVMARYLRIWMTEGSGIAASGSNDPRDAMGYAIREIMAGEAGRFDFDDHVIHRPDKTQTITYASSTDPWHREGDRDPKTEQPGIDRIVRCGITRGLPLMLAIPVLYDTPENASALSEYARHSGIPVSRLELGEEPDGQRIAPSDFGALYAQTAHRVRKADPGAVMGGPSFVTLDVTKGDDKTYRFDKGWWIRDFRRELLRRGQGGDFQFLSFEWYPFDDAGEPEQKQLDRSFKMLQRTLRRLRPLGLPLVIGESNYSVFPCRQEVDLSGGLLNAEIAAQFLCGGGETVYYYGYEPNTLEEHSGSWGNQLMLLRRGRESIPVATFQTLRLLRNEWMSPWGGSHNVLPLRSQIIMGKGDSVSAFALRRPDGTRSLLVINKDAKCPLRLSVKGLGKQFVTITTYSSAEYSWLPDGKDGKPLRKLPPSKKVLSDQPINIPPWSLSVIK